MILNLSKTHPNDSIRQPTKDQCDEYVTPDFLIVQTSILLV